MKKNKTSIIQMPWYLSTPLICILAAFWFFIVPGILAIFLLFKQHLYIEDLQTNQSDFEKMKADNKRLFEENETLKHSIPEREDKTLTEQIKYKREKLDKLSKQIIVAEDIVEMESFALYTPKWKFATADEYKDKLKEIIDQQKQMIKNGTAATAGRSWNMNGSTAQGQKMTKNIIKLCLRSFNDECDAAVSSVKFSNYDRCAERIYKAAETTSKLSSILTIEINAEYVELKIKQLQLAHEYETKRQEEKEALKELRAQQREEAQARKEMEQARQAAEKEQTHYENALATINAQLEVCTEDKKADLENKKAEIETRLEDINKNIADLDYRAANIKAGYVYIISNIGAFGENVYKIGMTRRLDPQERVDELGDASVPFKFDVHAMIFSEDAPALEAALHREFEDKKVNMINGRKEFFRVSLDEIKRVVRENHDKVVEFTDVPDAEQYRETIKMLQ